MNRAAGIPQKPTKASAVILCERDGRFSWFYAGRRAGYHGISHGQPRARFRANDTKIRQHGIDRARLCQRLFLLGFHLHSDSHWRGGDAVAAARGNTLHAFGSHSACLVPVPRPSSLLAAQSHAAHGVGRPASLAGGNVGLIFAEKTVSSGLASLVLAVVPLYVALIETFLPGGEPLPRRGWLGMAIGFCGLGALLYPSLRTGLAGDSTLLLALGVLLAGAFSWTVGSIVARRSKLPANTLVSASWQMLAAGVFSALLGTALREWPQFHVDRAAVGSIAWLVTGGSLVGYTCFIYLLEHVPVAKVTSYAYVNPVVAVLLGIFLLHERPAPAEFGGMAAVIVAVFLLTTARMQASAKPSALEGSEPVPAE